MFGPPCEKLKRATSTPFNKSERIIVDDWEAGPMVAMILARRLEKFMREIIIYGFAITGYNEKRQLEDEFHTFASANPELIILILRPDNLLLQKRHFIVSGIGTNFKPRLRASRTM